MISAFVAAALLWAGAAQAAPELALPPGPAARAWSSTEPGAAAPLDARTISLASPETWNDEAAWSSWAEDLAAERSKPGADPARLARLALAALGQGRSEAAWDHFAALTGHGDWLAAVLPAFVPGVRPGAPPALPEGAVLAPALPPLAAPSSERVLGYGRLERREMTLAEVRVGDAVVDVRVGVEYDAVQVDVTHRSGGAASLTVVLPVPLDFELTTRYVDWEKRAAGEPLTISVSAETPKIEVAATCRPFRIRWPMTLPDELDERVRRHGFAVVVAGGDEIEPRVRGFAAALRRITGRDAAVRSPEQGGATPALELGFEPQPQRDHKLRSMAEALEHFALRR